MKLTHIHTFKHTPPFSQSAYNNSKTKITGNYAFSVKVNRKNSQIKIIRFTQYAVDGTLKSKEIT